jgi:hypothetical protein
MEWILTGLQVIWEQYMLVLLIPVVLIVVTLFLLPFEEAFNKCMALMDKYQEKNKFLYAVFCVLTFAFAIAPVVVVVMYF